MIPRELDFYSSIALTITVSAFATPWSLEESILMQSQLSDLHTDTISARDIVSWIIRATPSNRESPPPSEAVLVYKRWEIKFPILQDSIIYLYLE